MQRKAASCSAGTLRALDYTLGLYTFAVAHYETGLHWQLLDAFSEGYGAVHPLSPAEMEALPTLLRLGRMVSLLHWTGRTRQGLCPLADLQRRAHNLLAFFDWLAVHEQEVVARIQRAHRAHT